MRYFERLLELYELLCHPIFMLHSTKEPDIIINITSCRMLSHFIGIPHFFADFLIPANELYIFNFRFFFISICFLSELFFLHAVKQELGAKILKVHRS